MSQSISEDKCITALIDKQTGMRVADVMNPYPLNACFLASPLHLMGEEMLGSWEQSFVRVKHISGINKIL